MIVNEWINREDLERTSESVLLFLYLLRAATAEQLSVLLGLKKRTVVQYICKLNQQNRMIRSYRLGKTGERIYTLLPKGTEVVVDILGKVAYYPISKRQGKHWRGLNDIFLRLIQKIGLNSFTSDLTWYTASEAKQFLLEEWNRRQRKWDALKRQAAYRDALCPDAMLNIMGKISCWIEYDCATEGKQVLRAKYLEYSTKLVPVAKDDPVIWVCPNIQRKEQLIRWWEELKSELEQNGEDFSQAQFFTSGEETEFIMHVYRRIS